jgi:hypothetical protein
MLILLAAGVTDYDSFIFSIVTVKCVGFNRKMCTIHYRIYNKRRILRKPQFKVAVELARVDTTNNEYE